MSKNVLILSGSPRKGGNSDILCDEFLRGAVESGHNAEKIRITEKNIGYCRACYACKDTDVCVIKDDMAEILKKMHWADVLVMSSPVYFYSINAQMKALIDRTLAQWTSLDNKEMYYIMTAAEDSDTVMDCTLECFRGFAVCLNDAVEKGVIYGKGVYESGEVKNTKLMQEAYEMGRNV